MKFFAKTKGAISIFLVIILVPMLTVASIMVDSSRIKLGKAMAESAGDLTLNTALTNYDTILKEVYGLFAMSQNEEDLTANLEAYFKKSIMASNLPEDVAEGYTQNIMNSLKSRFFGDDPEADYSDFMKIDFSNFKAEKIPNSQLSNPSVMKREIVEFMKYRAPISMGMGFLQAIKSFKDIEKKNNVVDKKTKYYDQQSTVMEKCKDLYNKIEKYLKIRQNESDVDVGITNSFLEKLHDLLNNSDSQYKVYNEKLVRNLFDDSLSVQPPKHIISGSDGTYSVVRVSDGGSADTTPGLFDTEVSLRSTFNNRIRELNTKSQLINEMHTNSVDSLYAIQLVRQYNNMRFGEQINDINQSFCKLRNIILDNDPEADIESTPEYEDYVEVMDKAVAIYNKVDRAYDTISYNFSAEANLLSNDLNVFATRIFQDRAALNEAITTLADAIEGAQAVIDAINELESKKADWGTALESSPEGDEFTTSTQAEYDNISELFKVEEVQALKDRLSQIKSVIDEVYPHIDNYKYGSKKLYDIRDLNNMRSAVNVKTSASYPGKTISEPPIIKTDLDRFHVDIFNSNYFVGAFNGRNRENINFRDDPPEFFKYLHANFANSTEDEGKKDELINNTNDMAADAADDVADATSGNSSVSFVFDKVALNLPSGDAGALVPESANANIGSNDSDSLEDDAGKEALSNNSNFITELFSGFGDIISDFGISMRDNLYVTEYGLKMFSHDTFENEIRYNMAEAAQKTDLGQMMSLNAAELTEEQKEKAITMTTVPISAENNAAYGAEVEYIIFGKQNAKDNVTIAYTSIFGIRFVLNSIYAFTDSEIRTTTLTIATPISAATLGVIPVPLIQAVLQIAIALAETTYDLLCLSEGMAVPIYKNKDTWVMSPSGLMDKMAGVAAGLAKNVVDESAVYLQEVLDKTDQELTELGEEGLRKLDESLNSAFTSILDNAVGGVIIQATEACRQAVEEANAVGQDAMSKVDEVKASLDASLSNYIAEEPNPELQEAKEKAKDIVLNGGTDYIESMIETMQNKVKVSLEEVQANLQSLTGEISEYISISITNNIDSMFNRYKEEAINSIKASISSGQTALKKSIDEAFGRFGGSGGGTAGPGAGSAASSIFSFKYSDYLKLFLFIGCFANGDGVVKRMADVVQVNVAQKLEHPVGDGFLMSEAYTYARISADIEVKPLLITIPLIAETIKNDQTDTSWYKFKYSGIRSY